MATTVRPVDTADSPEFGRGLSFTDAIYGFAITLLVVNIDVPDASDWESLSTLASSGFFGQLFGFTLSFAVIAVFWRVNFRLVRSISGMTSAVLTANIVGAFFIVLLPFTTQGTSDPGTRDLALPTALYALNVALAAMCQSAMYLIAELQGLTGPVPTRKYLVAQTLQASAVPIVFLVSIPVALAWGPNPARLMWLSLLVIGPLVGRNHTRQARVVRPT